MNVVSLSARSKKGARTKAKMRTARGGCAVVGCPIPRDTQHRLCKAHRAEENRRKKDAAVRRELATLIKKAGIGGFNDAPFPLPMVAMGDER